jgi:hypothetical protein
VPGWLPGWHTIGRAYAAGVLAPCQCRANPAAKIAIARSCKYPLDCYAQGVVIARRDAEERFAVMWNIFVFAILSGMVGLIAYEIFQEVGGSSGALHDHYHE